jgi:hypothetical protein
MKSLDAALAAELMFYMYEEKKENRLTASKISRHKQEHSV